MSRATCVTSFSVNDDLILLVTLQIVQRVQRVWWYKKGIIESLQNWGYKTKIDSKKRTYGDETSCKEEWNSTIKRLPVGWTEMKIYSRSFLSSDYCQYKTQIFIRILYLRNEGFGPDNPFKGNITRKPPVSDRTLRLPMYLGKSEFPLPTRNLRINWDFPS